MTALSDTLALATTDLKSTYESALALAGADADRGGPRPDDHDFTLNITRSDVDPYPYLFTARILWGEQAVEPFYIDGSVESLRVEGDTPTHFILRCLIYCLKVNGY